MSASWNALDQGTMSIIFNMIAIANMISSIRLTCVGWRRLTFISLVLPKKITLIHKGFSQGRKRDLPEKVQLAPFSGTPQCMQFYSLFRPSHLATHGDKDIAAMDLMGLTCCGLTSIVDMTPMIFSVQSLRTNITDMLAIAPFKSLRELSLCGGGLWYGGDGARISRIAWLSTLTELVKLQVPLFNMCDLVSLPRSITDLDIEDVVDFGHRVGFESLLTLRLTSFKMTRPQLPRCHISNDQLHRMSMAWRDSLTSLYLGWNNGFSGYQFIIGTVGTDSKSTEFGFPSLTRLDLDARYITTAWLTGVLSSLRNPLPHMTLFDKETSSRLVLANQCKDNVDIIERHTQPR
jgi:hypothetical protein